MTVNVMTKEGVVTRTAEPAAASETEPEMTGQDGFQTEKPIVYTRPEDVYSFPSASSRRRRNGSFGNILFVQLILSALFAVGIWAGGTFGGDDIRAVCESLAELFR